MTGSCFGFAGIVLIVLYAGWLLSLPLTLLMPRLTLLHVSVGSIFYTVGWIWVVLIAYKDDGWSGTLCLFTNLYVFVYAYVNLESTWKPAGLMLLGLLMIFSSYAMRLL